MTNAVKCGALCVDSGENVLSARSNTEQKNAPLQNNKSIDLVSSGADNYRIYGRTMTFIASRSFIVR